MLDGEGRAEKLFRLRWEIIDWMITGWKTQAGSTQNGRIQDGSRVFGSRGVYLLSRRRFDRDYKEDWGLIDEMGVYKKGWMEM